MTVVVDPRLAALGVTYRETPGAVWKLTSLVYEDETQSGGNHNIYFTVFGADGKPAPDVVCEVDWVGRDPTDDIYHGVTDAAGQVNFGMYANLDIHLLNGPYFGYVGSQAQSDVVTGMGLPENRHVNFKLGFQHVGVIPPVPSSSADVNLREFLAMQFEGMAKLIRMLK